ncbi:MAG: hypothetical protein R3Y64_09025 [Peptostreptococcaceae bacterium]
MKDDDEFLYKLNYHALLACILNKDLTPGEAIERLINPKPFGFISANMSLNKDKNKKTKSYVIEDTLENKKFYFEDRKKLVKFFETKDNFDKSALFSAMYRKVRYRKRYYITRKF